MRTLVRSQWLHSYSTLDWGFAPDARPSPSAAQEEGSWLGPEQFERRADPPRDHEAVEVVVHEAPGAFKSQESAHYESTSPAEVFPDIGFAAPAMGGNVARATHAKHPARMRPAPTAHGDGSRGGFAANPGGARGAGPGLRGPHPPHEVRQLLAPRLR